MLFNEELIVSACEITLASSSSNFAPVKSKVNKFLKD